MSDASGQDSASAAPTASPEQPSGTGLAALEQVHRLWLQTFDALNDAVFVHDADFRIVRANAAYARLAGRPFGALIGRPYFEVFPPTAGPLPGCAKLTGHGHDHGEEEFGLPDGRVFRSRSGAIAPEDGSTRYLHVLEDVTAQRALERHARQLTTALHRSDMRLQAAERLASLGAWELDFATGTVTCTQEVGRVFGTAAEQLACFEAFLPLVHPDDREHLRRVHRDARSGSEDLQCRYRVLRPNGDVRHVRSGGQVLQDDAGQPQRAVGFVQDVTDQVATETTLRRTNRALRALSASNAAMLHAIDETKLLADTCRLLVVEAGYRFAWVGTVEQDADRSIRPLAWHGHEAGYLDGIRLAWAADNPRGDGPAGRAVRSGQPQIVADVRTDACFAPWREAALARGYAAAIVLPVTPDGRPSHLLAIYSAEAQAFDRDETDLLTELSHNLAYGMANLGARRERDALAESQRRTAEQLAAALSGTVRALAAALEQRDPYTAGHQDRVAHLAVAIGSELGLDDDRLQGLRLGATIHDIGKIYVPAEILSRPGRLSAAEYELVKAHPLVGYDIVKAVDFPWPVADMIHQHQERSDGSGYPRGLVGDAILLEARIIAVADVVESMASHRPYRPALGVEAALAELLTGRGSRYDAAVVDACLRLFREHGYRLSDAPSSDQTPDGP